MNFTEKEAARTMSQDLAGDILNGTYKVLTPGTHQVTFDQELQNNEELKMSFIRMINEIGGFRQREFDRPKYTNQLKEAIKGHIANTDDNHDTNYSQIAEQMLEAMIGASQQLYRASQTTAQR